MWSQSFPIPQDWKIKEDKTGSTIFSATEHLQLLPEPLASIIPFPYLLSSVLALVILHLFVVLVDTPPLNIFLQDLGQFAKALSWAVEAIEMLITKRDNAATCLQLRGKLTSSEYGRMMLEVEPQ